MFVAKTNAYIHVTSGGPYATRGGATGMATNGFGHSTL